MNAKKTIKQYVAPSFVLGILLLIPPFTIFGLIVLLFGTLPESNKASKSIATLEAAGELERAAAELMSQSAKRLVNGKVIFTEHYIFCKGNGRIFTYDEVLWAYKNRFTQRFLLIPIKVTDSLCLATKTSKPANVASMGKDKMDEIKNAILEIYNHNPNCMVGYTNENVAKYKTLSK